MIQPFALVCVRRLIEYGRSGPSGWCLSRIFPSECGYRTIQCDVASRWWIGMLKVNLT